jgi:hypothetical protein
MKRTAIIIVAAMLIINTCGWVTATDDDDSLIVQDFEMYVYNLLNGIYKYKYDEVGEANANTFIQDYGEDAKKYAEVLGYALYTLEQRVGHWDQECNRLYEVLRSDSVRRINLLSEKIGKTRGWDYLDTAGHSNLAIESMNRVISGDNSTIQSMAQLTGISPDRAPNLIEDYAANKPEDEQNYPNLAGSYNKGTIVLRVEGNEYIGVEYTVRNGRRTAKTFLRLNKTPVLRSDGSIKHWTGQILGKYEDVWGECTVSYSGADRSRFHVWSRVNAKYLTPDM